MRTCENILSALHMLAEGLLDPKAAEETMEHVNTCESCARQLEDFRNTKTFIEQSLGDSLTVPNVVDRILETSPEPTRSTGRLRLALRWAGVSFATVALMIILLVTGYLYSRGFIGPKPVAARLTHVSHSGGEWEESDKKIRGMTDLVTNTEERRSLRLENGVTVIMNESTVLEVESVNNLTLAKGDIYVDAAGRKDLMLRIKTDNSTTYVNDTRFGISVKDKKTSVVVEEGKVSVESDWGEQVVVRGNIYRIIESMKPEEPEPVDVKEILFWIKEREHLSGMMLDYYERETEAIFEENDDELLNQLLYGLRQSRKAISSGDIIFDVSQTHYGFGHDLTEEEQKEYTEKVVAGHIAQLDPGAAPSEEEFQKLIEAAKDSASMSSESHTKDESHHWIFGGSDRVRLDEAYDNGTDFHTTLIINKDLRYRKIRKMLMQSKNGFKAGANPAFFGRSPCAVSDLRNPRLMGTEEIDGVTTYILEADIAENEDMDDNTYDCIVRLWIDPSRGYVVPKTYRHLGLGKYTFGISMETIAESFEEISPGVYYPNAYIVNSYRGDIFIGEKVLRKAMETRCTLRKGVFNEHVSSNAFDIPQGLPITEVDEFEREIFSEKEKMVRAAKKEEYLQEIYDEIEQIKRYDDPTAPGSRKIVFQLPYTADDFAGGVESGKGGVIFGPVFHNGEPVAARLLRVDPKIAPNIPLIEGDIIYTLNDKPWVLHGIPDIIIGLEGCIPYLNKGQPITGGIRRKGELMYVILWFN